MQKWQHFLFNIHYVSHGLYDTNSFEHAWSTWSTSSSMHDHRMLADLKFKVAVFPRDPAVIFILKRIKFAGILIQVQKNWTLPTFLEEERTYLTVVSKRLFWTEFRPTAWGKLVIIEQFSTHVIVTFTGKQKEAIWLQIFWRIMYEDFLVSRYKRDFGNISLYSKKK